VATGGEYGRKFKPMTTAVTTATIVTSVVTVRRSQRGTLRPVRSVTPRSYAGATPLVW